VFFTVSVPRNFLKFLVRRNIKKFENHCSICWWMYINHYKSLWSAHVFLSSCMSKPAFSSKALWISFAAVVYKMIGLGHFFWPLWSHQTSQHYSKWILKKSKKNFFQKNLIFKKKSSKKKIFFQKKSSHL